MSSTTLPTAAENELYQDVVVEHKRANGRRELVALPLTLKSSGLFALAFGCGRLDGLEGISRGP